MGCLISGSLSPFAFGFLVARARSAPPFLSALFPKVENMLVGDGHMESDRCTVHLFSSLSSSSGVRRKLSHSPCGSRTYERRMYDRGLKDLPPRPVDNLRYRIETLVGRTGFRMAKYRATWLEAVSAPFKVLWRPHLLSMLLFEVILLLILGYHSQSTKPHTGRSARFWHWCLRTYTIILLLVGCF
jgi:hypothetical protein